MPLKINAKLMARKRGALGQFIATLTGIREMGILLSLILMGVTLTILTPYFLTPTNLFTVARQFSIIAIIAVGQTLVILTAGIDLSVGSVLALSSCVMAKFMGSVSPNIGVGVVIGLAVGAVCGFFNGLMVTRIRLPPFIVTLGMMSIARGLTYVITGGWPVGNLPEGFKFFGHGDIVRVPVPVVLMVLVVLMGSIVLHKTGFGRYIYAIGGNELAARLSGINVDRVKVLVYTISGLLSALAGIVVTSRVTLAQPVAGSGYELDSIASTVVGGASLMGGEGTALGTVIGAAIMGVLKNGLVLLRIHANWHIVAIGLVVIVAVTIDQLRLRRRGG